MSPRILATFATPLLAAALLLAAPVQAQQTNLEAGTLRQEIEALRQGQRQILRQLDALQKAIRARPAAPRRRGPEPFKGADISIDGAPSKGSTGAKIVLVEFSDYQCPFCRRFATTTLPQVIKNYVDTGKLRYVFRDFPIAGIHPAATSAAQAAHCAGAQGKYWQMHDRFFATQRTLSQRKWKAHAVALGLDMTKFNQCLTDKNVANLVRKGVADGRKIGVTGTPAFYLGVISADGKIVKATEMIRGARPYASFKVIIDRLIAKHKG